MVEENQDVKDYIGRLRCSKPYLGQVEVLLSDILALSQDLDFQILKPEHLY